MKEGLPLSDLKQRAEEKAKQRISGTSSRRQEEKEILRNEINSYTGENVFTLNAVPQTMGERKLLRVAAYCRVSTDDIGQVISIEMQKREYQKKIKENPNWEYYGTFVDDGFSGTNTDHRPGFRRMMEDAIAGKFDVIITKSVSRFARNLLDCIGWVRKLQNHDPPIAVIFEDVNLNTLDQTSNLILFVLAMVAEEESHMKSEAMLISLEWRFSRGRFLIPRLLGYDTVKGPDGKKTLVIVPEEANTVRLMFYMLLNGSNLDEIAATLTDLGRLTGSGSSVWNAGKVRGYLRNERYCGDILARKTWTPNFHDHKSKKNRGAKNRYFQPNHHMAIVSRAQWNAAQKILNSAKFSRNHKFHPMRVVTTGALRGFVSINVHWAGYDADDYYRISSVVMGEAEGNLDLEQEYLPDGGLRLTGLSDEEGIQRIARELSEAEKAVQAEIEGTDAGNEQTDSEDPDGFQVASGDMFSHRNDPVIHFTRNSIKLNGALQNRLLAETVEILLNPLERLLAVRKCDPSNPNAISLGSKNPICATPFCRILFDMLGWNAECRYQVLASFRMKGGEGVVLLDLDNCIAKVPGKETEDQPVEQIAEKQETNDSGKVIFYGADDEALTVEKQAEEEERRRRLEEIESRTFGSPIFEHDGNIRYSPIDDDGEWDIFADAVEQDSDYKVDDDTVLGLQLEMLEEKKNDLQ